MTDNKTVLSDDEWQAFMERLEQEPKNLARLAELMKSKPVWEVTDDAKRKALQSLNNWQSDPNRFTCAYGQLTAAEIGLCQNLETIRAALQTPSELRESHDRLLEALRKIKKGSSGVYKEEISMDRVHEIATEAITKAEKLQEGK